ncbi:MAG: LacI family DNA-binding transcriptional regulator [Clostridia bacterium]|nr:LacI family DNA-binding transcriptional regulator [Clostridia bacterium]
MRATLKQIAEMSGVHRSTVDKVLHGREGVSPEVRDRVQKIIDELGYQPNAIGKALAQQKNPKVIAVLLLRVDAQKEIRNGIESAYDELKSFGLKLEYFISREDDSVEQLSYLTMLTKRKIDGLLIMPIDHPDIIKSINTLTDNKVPVITINTDLPDSKRICFVGQDSVKAGRVAGELLGEIIGGKGRVAQITSSERMLCSVERQNGFEQVIRERYPEIKIVDTLETYEEALVAFQKTINLINTHKDLNGIYVTCGNVSEVGRAVRMLNCENRIKIISFDLYPEITKLVHTGIINFTIGQNLPAQGYKGLKVLFDLVFANKMPASTFIGTAIDIRMRENINIE